MDENYLASDDIAQHVLLPGGRPTSRPYLALVVATSTLSPP